MVACTPQYSKNFHDIDNLKESFIEKIIILKWISWSWKSNLRTFIDIKKKSDDFVVYNNGIKVNLKRLRILSTGNNRKYF